MSIPADGSKERTLSHMNKDHRRDLSAILIHKLGVSCSSPELTDISLSSLTVRANDQTYTIPISPPLATWSDRRARLVDMTMAARQALNLDAAGKPLVVRTFLPPSGLSAVVFAGVVFYFTSFAAVKGGLVEPGSAAWKAIDAVGFPGGPVAFKRITSKIFLAVMAIHLGESWWLHRTRLSRFGVVRGTGLWWAWMLRCFVEGITTFKSFDALVARLRKGE